MGRGREAGRWRGGVTLVELLVAVSVLLVIGAVAAPGAAAMRDALALREAASRIAADLRAQRMRALERGRDQRVVFAPGAASYRVEEESGAGHAAVGPPRDLPAGVVVERCTAPGGAIVFRPRGHATGFGTITVRNRAGATRRIIVNITGRVRVG